MKNIKTSNYKKEAVEMDPVAERIKEIEISQLKDMKKGLEFEVGFRAKQVEQLQDENKRLRETLEKIQKSNADKDESRYPTDTPMGLEDDNPVSGIDY